MNYYAENIIPNDEVGELYTRLREVWSASTSASDNWTSERPENGQCAVTALVVQDTFGGILLRSVVNGVSHYWNRLPNGVEADLTLAQFDEPLSYSEDVVIREREYVLSFPATAERYRILSEALDNDVDPALVASLRV